MPKSERKREMQLFFDEKKRNFLISFFYQQKRAFIIVIKVWVSASDGISLSEEAAVTECIKDSNLREKKTIFESILTSFELNVIF